MGAIYRAVCRVNGKVYVGQTKHSGWRQRYKGYEKYPRRLARLGKPLRPFDKAILKYGLASFEFRDLMTNVSPEYLDKFEVFFIRHFHATDRNRGYNVEPGGYRAKESFVRARKEVDSRRKVRRWSHPQFGLVVGCAGDVAAVDPSVTVLYLHKVGNGRSRYHRGWVCLDVPQKKVRVRAPHVWEHDTYGRVVASTSGLARMFPEQNLKRQQLSYVANPRYPDEGSHRGWRYLRAPTAEEELACRVAGNL